MRGWLFGSRDAVDERTERGTGLPPDSGSGTHSTAGRSGGQDGMIPGPGSERGDRQGLQGNRALQSSAKQKDGFMAFMARGTSAADAEMERRVSVAARNLGDGVQRIVMAAKGSGRQHGGSHSEWKAQLLRLLGGSDEDQGGMFSTNESDIDTLLENSLCDKFVLRCVENELPPNLIHCLRLLRVLELQHANAQQQRGQGAAQSISTTATSKVSRLLCLLCTDPSVGEQLRPHLFGLLALSGASYPSSGVHVSGAASAVIIAFSENCLSTSLVWFLHDRKMIIHMTDDIKELCGMAAASSSASSTLCLYGDAAEEAGLWVVALKTVVNVVVHSCNHQCLELLNDFNTAGGYHVLCYAIANSNNSHAKKLLELVTILACCKTDVDHDAARMGDDVENGDNETDVDLRADQDKENSKLASNPAAFDIVEDLMVRSVPLLKEFDQVYGGERPEISTEESLRELSTFSMRTALNVRFAGISTTSSDEFNLAMELLVTTLQMYSDHARNYEIIEERHSILSYYLLAFPTFEDVSLKVLILKTLEYVLTGVAGTDAIKPLTVASEIYFALCKSLLKGANGIELDSEEEAKIYDSLLMDAEMMCGTIEKLLEFDDRVSQIMIDGGLLSNKLGEVLDYVMQVTDSTAEQRNGMFMADGKMFFEPPLTTPLDRVFASICRVLKLVVSKSAGSPNNYDDPRGPTNLNVLLVTAVNQLGDEASSAALGVMEAKMACETNLDLLRTDMEFVMELLDHFAEMTGRMRCISIFRPVSKRKRGMSVEVKNSTEQKLSDQEKRAINPHTILREAAVFNMIKSVLEGSDIAQDAFRMSAGFESVIRAPLCLEGVVDELESSQYNWQQDDMEAAGTTESATLKLIESLYGVLSAATIPSVYRQISSILPLSATYGCADVLTEEFSSQMFASSIGTNKQHLNRRGFYVDFATAIAGTGILNTSRDALAVVNLSLAFIDPSLRFSTETNVKKEDQKKAFFVRNPDASRLAMGIATCLPMTELGMTLSKRVLDEMLRLCASDMTGSTLSQIASCGLCWSITNDDEFAHILVDRSHHLYSRFVLLLRRIAAFSMTYMDFVGMLRCVAGPILRPDTKDRRIRLAVISSSVKVQSTQPHLSQEVIMSEAWQAREADFCNRLETLSIIAERGDRIPRCEVGGDSLNTIAVYMHETPIEDRLYKMAEESRLKFLEIESIDSSATNPGGSSTSGTQAPSSNAGERVWTPLASTGFTYSVWLRMAKPFPDGVAGNLFVLDLSSPASSGHQDYLALWYDIQFQRFTVLTSTSYRNEPICFPVSPLRQGVWHHVMVTYIPPKRPMLSRKAILGVFVDGRPLEAEVRVESVNLPPNTRVHIGTPNPHLAVSGYVRGILPVWELGPTLMLGTILSNLDATAIFMNGPDFQGMFWGDRPQRLSLAAASTAAFAMLAESGEQGSVAGALRRRDIPRLEAAGTVTRERGADQVVDSDSLASLGLLCIVNPDVVLFGFRAVSTNSNMRSGSKSAKKKGFAVRLINVARINSNHEDVSTDAIVYGTGSVVAPHCFADNIQWVGGPSILLPIINAASSARTLALALRLIRESVYRNPPNLEMLQAGGGYKMLAVLLRQKKIMDASVLDQCVAFAVHGFQPLEIEKAEESINGDSQLRRIPDQWPSSDKWVFADLDAIKYLLLNHQVWDMRNSGPDLPLRLLSYLNGLVAQNSSHKAFNSRRLHLLGIVRWTLHLMLEATELYTLGEIAMAQTKSSLGEGDTEASGPSNFAAASALANGWYCPPPAVESTSVGGDPDNALLQACKTLLRRVLTFMLTPGDLEAIAEAAIYTVSISTNGRVGGSGQRPMGQEFDNSEDEMLPPGPVARVYLLRLIEELVVDGVNEIVASGIDKKSEGEGNSEPTIQPHAGGGASTNQSYLTATLMRGKRRPGFDGSTSDDFMFHPKHQQAQAFLNAFAGVLTPVWFACLLEGCHEEASASAVLRLMILMLQSSPMFAGGFEEAGGFAPLVLSIPKFSTCPSITMSMLSQLLHAPILHLPCFGVLDAAQLCEVFDSESDTTDLVMNESGGLQHQSDPSCGIFALLAECLGRNIQLAPFSNELGQKARQTNEAVLQLLSHRHRFSTAFQEFCRTPDFLEPLAQALCLVHDEKLQRMQQQQGTPQSDTFTPNLQSGPASKMRRRGSLAEVPQNESATERFVGRPEEETGSSGIGMVQLLRLVVSHAVLTGPLAAPLISALFRSFPIHASPEQVEAFHLVLIEHCKSVVEDALQRGEPIALANCIGVSSVLLDRLMAGFFTSEPVLEAVNIAVSTLICLVTSGSYASRTLGNAEQNLLTADAAHLSRLTTLTALQRSRPSSPYDEGDEDLKAALLDIISENLSSLLLVPSGGGNQGPRRQTLMSVNSAFPTPPPGSRMYPLWQSASLARCCPPSLQCAYPDLTTMEEPDRAFVVALVDEIHSLLVDSREDLRDTAVTMVVALLQQRRGMMSELLIAEVPRGDRMETIDIMNRGGFGALLVAHEAATIAENVSTVPRRSGGTSQGSKKKYASFFDWLERNQAQVDAVFRTIHIQSTRLFPGLEMGAATPEDAIENEQKSMLLRLTSQDSSDRTILGGLERAELSQRSHEKTADSQLLWKRQGFDDLSSGALQWKVLLRQLKGSCSIWEGGSWYDEEDQTPFSKSRVLEALVLRDKEPQRNGSDKEEKTTNRYVYSSSELVTRWKLDLTEGYERQRRRMLPNYEWYGLYGLNEGDDEGNGNKPAERMTVEEEDEDDDATVDSGVLSNIIKTSFGVGGPNANSRASGQARRPTTAEFFVPTESLEDAAALLNKLKIKKMDNEDEDDFDDYDIDTTAASSLSGTDSDIVTKGESTSGSPPETKVQPTIIEGEQSTDHTNGEKDDNDDEKKEDNVNASSYDLITGLLRAGDWPEKSYNVSRCMGLEVVKALLLWCRSAVYIIDGFELTEGEGLEGKIERVEKETSTFYINLRKKSGEEGAESRHNQDAQGSHAKSKEDPDESEDVTYQHRSQRISFNEVYSVFQRRYQLQNVALEFFDIHRSGTLVAFNSQNEREEVLNKVLNSPLPNSIFSSSYGTSINYKKFMSSWKTKIIAQWVSGKMTNFDLLMNVNSFAGRSYNDLTQYPVFPWVIADYESEELDLDNPKTYRDLSKPMGGQGESRAQQFREKYIMYEESGMEPAHYGTHYSCAAYVLYYLMRLEPFSRLALRLQGGRFDVADRLFHNLGSSWRSASAENQQDVRELIPEFFYLPEFLDNKNGFDFGITQTGKTIDDVTLPAWAKGSPERFIRLNRQALESEYVSRHLNHWIDLVFGYKQKGREAIAALNVFPHYSYEGNIDIDSLDDPILRESAIQSAQNFGQTPKMIERKPFAQRLVQVALKEKNIDFGALSYLAPLTPPFCMVGAPQRVYVRPTLTDTVKVGMAGQTDASVGDMCLVKGQIVGVGRNCTLIIPQKKYYRYGGPNNGVSVHVATTSARHHKLNKMLSIHDSMHRAPISVATASLNGMWLVTGCVDSTVRVWRYDGQSMDLRATLCGHEGGHVTCIDVSTAFGTIVTGCSLGNVLLWDLRTLTFLRRLRHPFKEDAEKLPGAPTENPAISVSINHKTGNVVTLVGSHLSVFDINGQYLCSVGPGLHFGHSTRPSCAVSTDCPEWMERGIVAVTGHVNGDIRFWGMDYDSRVLKMRHMLLEKPHTCAITSLKVEGERQDTLLVGDKKGVMSICKTVLLEALNQQELISVTEELRKGVKESNLQIDRKAASLETVNWIGYMTGADT